MKGIELSRKFYEAYGKQMLIENFEEHLDKITVGVAGEGSECFGFDDCISTDHDFEPAFCIWISSKDYDNFGFELERAYAKLPKEFEGFTRCTATAVGGNRRSVIKTEEFYRKFLGSAGAPESLEQWLYLPPSSLACACNGEVFFGSSTDFLKTREILLQGYPKDVLLKKLAANMIMMAQSGLYNFERCIKRGETGAAQLCVFEFAKHAVSAVHLLNNTYEPFYKWSLRSLRGLNMLSQLETDISSIIQTGNSPQDVTAKRRIIEGVCNAIVSEAKRLRYTESDSSDIERQAFCVRNMIKDVNIRNMHIMDGI